jgi:hypothetical protein
VEFARVHEDVGLRVTRYWVRCHGKEDRLSITHMQAMVRPITEWVAFAGTSGQEEP